MQLNLPLLSIEYIQTSKAESHGRKNVKSTIQENGIDFTAVAAGWLLEPNCTLNAKRHGKWTVFEQFDDRAHPGHLRTSAGDGSG